ncbi:SOS response-associated peptidase family protein [Pseudomonas sp. UBA7530]|uniref:SOS response-associated peptidase family protein n=1 Tax=Pseudomonas sp. UBA7530 TaxID=1947341 RepID=UPI0025F91B35|nr:SOS response-associated peptidase family protein [Pseudomonas sp. UBA7530]
MCGRIAQYSGIREFVDALSGWPERERLQAAEGVPPRYNVAPSTQVSLLHVLDDELVVERLRWGWRPHWAKDRAAPINARVEKVAHGAFFRAIWKHRAICPIDGWFEWVDEGGKRKQPYFIRRRDGRPTLCAAIGSFPTPGADAGEHDGFVIITADAQGGMVDVHDRRPVALSGDLAKAWLDTGTASEDAEQIVLHSGDPAEDFEWYRVDPAVGNVRNQGEHLIKPL